MINQTLWLQVKRETRNKLRELFNIPRTGTIWVRDNVVVCDGSVDKDLEVLTGEKLADFVGQEGTLEELFIKAVDLIEHNVIISPLQPDTTSKTNETTESTIKCEICGKQGFKSKLGLAGHKRSHK